MDGIKIGHYTGDGTGVTAVLAPEGAVGGCSIRGAAPATRETALLDSHKMIQKIHAVVLAGGSAFGLEACGGVMRYLHEAGIGFPAGAHKVPIVCGAAIFDLNSAELKYPDADAGYNACKQAKGCTSKTGRIGAGTGATVGKACGPQFCSPGGVGYAARKIGDLEIAALVVANALGDIVKDGVIIAGAKAGGKGGGFLNCNKAILSMGNVRGQAGQNTTLGVIMTNASLSKVQVNKLADITHNAYAMCISPVHTEFDGDIIFGLATGGVEADYNIVAAHAVDVMKEAIWSVAAN